MNCEICGIKANGENYIEYSRLKYARVCNRCFEEYELTDMKEIKKLLKSNKTDKKQNI